MSARLGRALSNRYLIWVIATALVCLGPWVGLTSTLIRLVVIVAMVSLVTSGLNLSWGYGGELALGQAAVYAVGAYVAGYIAKYILNDVIVVAILAAVAAFLVGLITGIPGLRLGGWTLAMISFFLVVLVPSVVNLFGPLLGGFSGLAGIPLPMIFGVPLDQNGFYILVIVVTSAWFLVFYNMVKGRFGVSLLVLRSSPTLASSLGVWPFQSKLTAYAVAAIPAGLGGMLFSYLDGFIAPDSFSLTLTILILAASIVGGPRSIFGVFLGVAILEIIQLEVGAFQIYATVAYGVLLVVAGVVLSDGVTPYLSRGLKWLVKFFTRNRKRTESTEITTATFSQTAAVLDQVPHRALVVTSISKSFGGNAALTDVSLRAEPGQITALIGPNGSGKTTMLNVISGFYKADSGQVVLGDQAITGLAPHRVSRAGVGRTFQTPQIPEYVSVADAILSGRLGSSSASPLGSAFRTPGYRRMVKRDNERLTSVASALGLTPYLANDASSLPLGTRRILELARVLVGQRSALLLDEVASGLDESEIQELLSAVRLMRDLGATVLLVEHNFELVRILADRVVVLADGKLLAEGTPDEIASHPEVLASYLGEGAGISGTNLGAKKERS
ncbi:MAG: branched-chain amino acid transporter substrate-binding protein [Microbacteriaceae bacterium]|nr:branched-chain amino acid transporter substrate-binding protein [Microbacteriaceae bacterium]